MKFDTVSLSPLTGRLLMSRLPGAEESSVDSFRDALKGAQADAVICLVPREEINKKSPSYMSELSAKATPVPVIEHGIHEYGIPTDLAAFARLVFQVKTGVQGGKKYWVHCASGQGRTGLFVGCVLRSLGYSGYEVLDMLEPWGPETRAQAMFLDSFEPLTSLVEEKPAVKAPAKPAPAKASAVKPKAAKKKAAAKRPAAKVSHVKGTVVKRTTVKKKAAAPAKKTVAKKKPAAKKAGSKKPIVKQVIAKANVVRGKAAKKRAAPKKKMIPVKSAKKPAVLKKKVAPAKAKKSLPKKKVVAKKGGKAARR